MSRDKQQASGQQIDCFACRHFYVTWDAAMPRGCRAFGFKTRLIPAQQVLAASGQPCTLFEPKPERSSSPPPRRRNGWTA